MLNIWFLSAAVEECAHISTLFLCYFVQLVVLDLHFKVGHTPIIVGHQLSYLLQTSVLQQVVNTSHL